MELLNFTFAANETKRFERAGRYIEVIDATYPISLFLSDSGGGRVDHALNALSGLFLEGAYSSVEMTNGATAQTVTLLVTDGRGGSRRQPGTVQVVDGGRARTLADQAFVGYRSRAGGVATMPFVQLFNPAASGKRVTVNAMRLSTPTAGFVSVNWHAAALATGPTDPVNKRAGGPTSSAKLYDDALAATVGTTYESLAVGANLVVPFFLQEPIVIAPGTGLVVHHQTVNTTILATLEFVEEPLT